MCENAKLLAGDLRWSIRIYRTPLFPEGQENVCGCGFVTDLGTLQVLARGEALMRGKHGSFLHGYSASHTDQTRLKV